MVSLRRVRFFGGADVGRNTERTIGLLAFALLIIIIPAGAAEPGGLGVSRRGELVALGAPSPAAIAAAAAADATAARRASVDARASASTDLARSDAKLLSRAAKCL